MKKIVIVIVLLLLIGGWMIKQDYEVDFDDKDDQKTFLKVLGKWIAGLGKNMASVTAYVVNLDWAPPENTNSTENG